MIKEKFKELIKIKEGEDNKKKIENLVIFVIILIVTIVVINVIWNGDKNINQDELTSDKNKKLATETQIVEKDNDTIEDNIVTDLEDILSNINGVGKVKVMITYSQTSQTIPLYNEDSSQKITEETDTQGGNRKITETDTKTEIIYQEDDGTKTPITQSIVSPRIEGAIITAEGAGSATIKTNIIQAVEAVTGVATHKIQVFEMSKE